MPRTLPVRDFVAVGAEATVLAYLAGVIDSDGFISAAVSSHKGRRYYAASVGIAGTRREPHDLAASIFGGKVYEYVPRGDRAHNRVVFQWQRYGPAAAIVITTVAPYLRVKQEQADGAIWLQEAVEEAKFMRASDQPYPWFSPGFDPLPNIAALAEYVRDLNVRGNRGLATKRAGRLLDGELHDGHPVPAGARP